MNWRGFRTLLLVCPPLLVIGLALVSVKLALELLLVYLLGWSLWIVIRPIGRARLRAVFYWRRFCRSHGETQDLNDAKELCAADAIIEDLPFSLRIRINCNGIELSNLLYEVGPAYIHWSQISAVEVRDGFWKDSESGRRISAARLYSRNGEWNTLILGWDQDFDIFVPSSVGLIHR